jgi:nitroimidazol reductase NimA-like FMN-containing flavoprotein (pyridoxamine 5'-phosphate oxidase superfamily)
MPAEALHELLTHGFCGRLATCGADGWPYVLPLLYVYRPGEIWMHNTSAPGHLRSNLAHDSRGCFEVDEPGAVFPYGRFECDTSVAYRSVIAFGRVSILQERAAKQAFFEWFMAKYADRDWPKRSPGFFPRLDAVTVYSLAIERVSGKSAALPAVASRWPALDRSKSPQVRAPEGPE